jgi:toxin FitB
MGKIKSYLIDTNSLLEFVGQILPEKAHTFVKNVINDDFNISIINHIEVLGHVSATKELAEFINLANSHQLTEEVIKQTIDLRKQKT